MPYYVKMKLGIVSRYSMLQALSECVASDSFLWHKLHMGAIGATSFCLRVCAACANHNGE